MAFNGEIEAGILPEVTPLCLQSGSILAVDVEPVCVEIDRRIALTNASHEMLLRADRWANWCRRRLGNGLRGLRRRRKNLRSLLSTASKAQCAERDQGCGVANVHACGSFYQFQRGGFHIRSHKMCIRMPM